MEAKDIELYPGMIIVYLGLVVKYGKVEAKDTIEIKSFSRKGSGTIVVDYYNKTTGNFGAVNYKEIKKVFLQYI